MAHLALDSWADLDGWALSHSIPRLQTLPLDRFCNLVWYWATRNADEKERAKFETKLWMPPPEMKGKRIERGPWSAEAETAAFAKAKAMLSK